MPRVSLTRSIIVSITLGTALSGLALIAVAQSVSRDASTNPQAANATITTETEKSATATVTTATLATVHALSNESVLNTDEGVIDPATRLGRDTHARAAGIDRLPRFYCVSDSGTLGRFILADASKDPLDNLIRSLDAPDGEAKWFQYRAQFGWDENHFVQGMGGTPKDEISQFQWGTRELAGEQNGRGETVTHVLQQDAASLWKKLYLTFPNYLLATRHEFWWGDNGDHRKILVGTGVPPAMAEYEQLPDKDFDGELCDVIRSKARQEMLFISKASGLLRGYVLISADRYPDDFYKSDDLKKITGVEFSSQRGYIDWFQANETNMKDPQKWQLAKAWSLAGNWSTQTASLLVRFRDYREIAPGIMWPFREDRVQGGAMLNGKFEWTRSYEHVQEILVDRDLTEAVNALRPKEGEQIQDQRFHAIIDYRFSKDRSHAETMYLVDEAFRRQMEDQLVVERAKKPYESLLGKQAPKLPDLNWVGGERPELDGKPYLVHFWATWCGPCKNDVPLLKRFSDAGGKIIGMHPGGTPAQEVTAAIQAAELRYPIYVSPEESPSENPMIAGYPATLYPYCVLVDGNGMVVAHGSLMDENFDVFAQYWAIEQSAK